MPQSLSKIYVHIIFSTKERYPFLRESYIKEELEKYTARILYEIDSYAIEIKAMGNHIHILCNLSKTISISKLIGEIKRSTSKWIKNKNVKYKKFYWQRGYGVFSVSQSAKQKVTEYIRNQEIHHTHKSFQEEFRDFLEKYDINYNEKYIWS